MRQRKLTGVRAMRHDLLQRALTDAETGLPNERLLDLEMDRVMARSSRYGFPVGIITISCEGCGAGVLRRFAQAAAQSLRAADLLARTGDAELRLILTHRDTEGLPAVVDRLRRVASAFADQGLTIDVRMALAEVPGAADG